MKKQFSIFVLFVFLLCGTTKGQPTNPGSTSTVVVNSNGTHSVIINHGNTGIVVNPDGTHSTVVNHGTTSIVVNPDGSHSTVINHSTTAIVVNPNGTHSVLINPVYSSQPENDFTRSHPVWSPKLDQEIIGVWTLHKVYEYKKNMTEKHNPQQDRWIEFKADGSFISDGAPFGPNQGRWTANNEKSILYIDSEIADDDSEWKVFFTGNKTIWTGMGHPRKENTTLIHKRK